MPILDYAIQDSVLMCAPHTPLGEIIIYMGQAGKYIGLEDGLFATADSLDISYRSLVTSVKGELMPASNCLTVARDFCQNEFIPPIDCVYIVERSQLLGIFTLADLVPLITNNINLAVVKISEVMKQPVITLEKDFDVNKVLSLMSKSGLRYFPITDDIGHFLGIITPESLALRLQQELSETREKLECEIAQRCTLELALKKNENKLETRVEERTIELTNTNERLLQEIIEPQHIEDELNYRVEFEQLKVSLKEKEVLLKEIHHRVKNNLQIISSLLRLQTKYIHDKQAFEMFQDSHNRVRAMAIIHENLYQSNDLATIKISDYIRNLSNSLIQSYGVKWNIKIHLKVDEIFLKLENATPCGLILNELISNSIKHAFLEKDYGDIYVEFLKLPLNKYLLTVSDNGVGLPKDIEVHKNRSLGLQLVWNLVEQLEGTIACNTTLGTVFTITFIEQN